MNVPAYPDSKGKKFIISFLIFLCSSVTPFLLGPWTTSLSNSIRFTFCTGILLLFFLIAWKKIVRESGSLLTTPFFLLGILLCWFIVSASIASPIISGFSASMDIALLIGLFFLFRIAFTIETPRIFSTSLALSAFFLSMLGIIQVFFPVGEWIPPNKNFIPFATLQNENLLAEVLVLVLPLCWFGIKDGSGPLKKFSILTILLCLVCIYLTGCRSAWLVVLFFLIIFSIEHFGVVQKKIKLLAAILPFILLLAQIGFYGYRAIGVKDLPVSTRPSSSSLEERLILARASLRMYADKPFAGAGPGSWSVTSNQFGVRGWFMEYGTRFYNAPHHDLLRMLSETGIPGLVFYGSLLFFPLFCLSRKWLTSDPSEIKIPIGIAGFGAWIIFSLTAFPFGPVYHLVLFAFYLALSSLFFKGRLSFFSNKKLLPALVIVFLLFPFVFGGLRLRNEWIFSKGWNEFKKQDLQGALSLLKKVNTGYYPYDLRTGTPVSFFSSVAAHNLGDHESELIFLKEAIRLSPAHPLVMNNLGICYIENKEFIEADKTFLEALIFHPDFPSAAENLALLRLKMKEISESELWVKNPAFLTFLSGPFPQHELEKGIELRSRLNNEPFPYRGFYSSNIRGVLD